MPEVIVREFQAEGFTWGGTWTGRWKDYMHFEIGLAVYFGTVSMVSPEYEVKHVSPYDWALGPRAWRGTHQGSQSSPSPFRLRAGWACRRPKCSGPGRHGCPAQGCVRDALVDAVTWARTAAFALGRTERSQGNTGLLFQEAFGTTPAFVPPRGAHRGRRGTGGRCPRSTLVRGKNSVGRIGTSVSAGATQAFAQSAQRILRPTMPVPVGENDTLSAWAGPSGRTGVPAER